MPIAIGCAAHQIRSAFTIDINMILLTVYQIFVDFFRKSINCWEGQSGKMNTKGVIDHIPSLYLHNCSIQQIEYTKSRTNGPAQELNSPRLERAFPESGLGVSVSVIFKEIGT